MFIKIFIISCVLSLVSAAGKDPEWDYSSETGKPSEWYKSWPACNGTRQSPIAINSSVNCDDVNGDIVFSNYDSIPDNVQFVISNNGHAYTVSFEGFNGTSNRPTIKSGGLPGSFALIGFHFHWGSINTQGSEHSIDGESGAAELHLVHMNTNYTDVNVAKINDDGLAVLGSIIKIGKENENMKPLINVAKNIEYPGNTTKILGFPLSLLLPEMTDFYRYNGSLTTPGCQESVTWTVFRSMMEMSQAQLDALRGMKYFDKNNVTKQLVDTHRPEQPLYDRKVLCHIKVASSPSLPPTSKSNHLTSFILFNCFLAFVVFLFN